MINKFVYVMFYLIMNISNNDYMIVMVILFLVYKDFYLVCNILYYYRYIYIFLKLVIFIFKNSINLF